MSTTHKDEWVPIYLSWSTLHSSWYRCFKAQESFTNFFLHGQYWPSSDEILYFVYSHNKGYGTSLQEGHPSSEKNLTLKVANRWRENTFHWPLLAQHVVHRTTIIPNKLTYKHEWFIYSYHNLWYTELDFGVLDLEIATETTPRHGVRYLWKWREFVLYVLYK